MRNARMIICLSAVAMSVGVSRVGLAEDNCGGYHVTVGSRHINFSDDPTLSIHLAIGTAYGGTIKMRDKDGDEYVMVTSAPGPDGRGNWMFLGAYGTGKYVGAKWSGWGKTVRREGDVTIDVWGGTCK